MDEIIAGVRTFQRDVFPENRELFAQLARGQSPETLLITCSDSRIDPHLLTQSEPGQLFVLRNAGNLVPEYAPHDGGGVAATIEFAVQALRVPNIIICGHSGCGAMAGLLNPASLRNMPNVAEWLEHAAVVRESLVETGSMDSPEALERAVEANVIAQLGHLQTHPSVAEARAVGQVTLHGWVYDIASGEVTAYDETQKQFAPL